MHPFLKLFWKTWLRKKRKAWKISFSEKKKFFTRKRLYAYLFWELTKKEKYPRKLRFKKLLPKDGLGKFFLYSNLPENPGGLPQQLRSLCYFSWEFSLFFFGYPRLKEYKVYRFQKTARAALKITKLIPPYKPHRR